MNDKVNAARQIRKVLGITATLAISLAKLVKTSDDFRIIEFAKDCDTWARSPHDENLLLHIVHTMCNSRSPRPHRQQMLAIMGLLAHDVGTGHGNNHRGWLFQYLRGAQMIRAERWAAFRREAQDELNRRVPGAIILSDGTAYKPYRPCYAKPEDTIFTHGDELCWNRAARRAANKALARANARVYGA